MWPRCWRRASTAACAPSAAMVATAPLEAHALLIEDRAVGIVGRREVRVHRVELEIPSRPGAPATIVSQVVEPETEAIHPGVDLQVIAKALAAARPPPAPRRAAPGVEMVGVSAQSNRPSRSLTLSAPNTRISARTPAARSAAPSSMSAHASRSAPASSSARRHLPGAVAVRVRLHDGNHARARERPPARGSEPRNSTMRR